MNKLREKKGFKIIEILTVTVIAAVIIAVAIPNALRSRMNAENAYATQTLKNIARAAEEYARDHGGNYPTNITYLINDKYLQEDYTTGTRNGFNFVCAFNDQHYNCTATPETRRVDMISAVAGSAGFTGTGGGGGGVINVDSDETVYASISDGSKGKPRDIIGTIPSVCYGCGGGVIPPEVPPVYTSSCFLSGTPILLSNGKSAPIESLKVGDEIMAFDEKSGGLKPDKIKETFKHTAKEYLIVNGYLKATSNHPVYSNGKWVELGTLRIGDKLLNAKGQPETVTSLRLVKKQAKVYNLEVNPYHTYIASGLVVHNKVTTSTAE